MVLQSQVVILEEFSMEDTKSFLAAEQSARDILRRSGWNPPPHMQAPWFAGKGILLIGDPMQLAAVVEGSKSFMEEASSQICMQSWFRRLKPVMLRESVRIQGDQQMRDDFLRLIDELGHNVTGDRTSDFVNSILAPRVVKQPNGQPYPTVAKQIEAVVNSYDATQGMVACW
jgi:hypothetical protein